MRAWPLGSPGVQAESVAGSRSKLTPHIFLLIPNACLVSDYSQKEVRMQNRYSQTSAESGERVCV